MCYEAFELVILKKWYAVWQDMKSKVSISRLLYIVHLQIMNSVLQGFRKIFDWNEPELELLQLWFLHDSYEAAISMYY